MDPNQRPHSRDKEVASGTAHVVKGEQVAAGGPVGGQNSRPGSKPATGSKREGSVLPVRSGGSLLTLIIVIAVVFLLLRSCSGGASGTSVQLQEPEDSTSGTFMTEESYQPPQEIQEEPVSTVVSSNARDKRVVLRGGGQDVATIMVYMCGTDLESKHSMGTADLKEMLNAAT